MNIEKLDTGNGVSRSKMVNETSGMILGYIIIPSDIETGDISKYIKNCLRRERFDIFIENGGTMALNCLCLVNVIPDLKFPNKGGEIGSQVVLLVDKTTGSKMIIGVVSKVDESSQNEDGCFNFMRKVGKNIVSIKGDANNGVLSINVSGNTDNILTVNVSGKAVVKAKNFSLESENIKIKDNSIKIGEAKEAMLLGDETQKQLEELTKRVDGIIDAIKNSAVAPGDGGATFKANLIAATSTLPNPDFSDIKSAVSFLE